MVEVVSPDFKLFIENAVEITPHVCVDGIINLFGQFMGISD